MNRRRLVQLLVSLVIGAGCLWLAFRNAPIEETKDFILASKWWGPAGFTALFFTMLAVRTKRWAIQVHGVYGKPIPFREALAINAVAFGSVFLLPFRLGELVRPFLSQQRGLMTTSAGIANSAVERIVDGMVTTACFGLVLVVLGDRDLPDEVLLAGNGMLVLFGGAAIVLFIGYRWREASLRFWDRLLSMIHKKLADVLVGMLRSFLDGLACFRGPAAIASYLGLSVVFWTLNGLAMWVLMLGMGIDVEAEVAYFAVCFMVIAVMIPAPPGNLGNFHYFTKLALTLLGVAEAPALAFAVTSHALHVILLLAWGGLFVLLGDVSLDKIRAAAASGEDESTA